MARAFDAVVLMGPPGCGKSYLGSLLHAQGTAHFEDLESELMRRFGIGEAFAQRKAEALDFLEASYRQQLSSTALPMAIQSTGLSDREILLRLADEFKLLLVQVATSKETCVARVASRPDGNNLNNKSAFAARFYDFWLREVVPAYDFNLTVDGQDADGAVEMLRNALGA